MNGGGVAVRVVDILYWIMLFDSIVLFEARGCCTFETSVTFEVDFQDAIKQYMI